MSNVKMHDNETDIDESLVRKLLNEQFPQWANLPITLVQSAGTDNAIYRLGADKCVRLPRIPGAAKDVEKEQLWLPLFVSTLSLTIPTPVGRGNPTEIYPFKWSIFPWIEGGNATADLILDKNQAAVALAQFIIALQKISITNAPPSRRGVPLATQDNETRHTIKSLQTSINTKAVTALWEESLQVSNWDKPPVWTHGDLLPSNIPIASENARFAALN